MALQKRNKTFADYVKEIFTVADTYSGMKWTQSERNKMMCNEWRRNIKLCRSVKTISAVTSINYYNAS